MTIHRFKVSPALPPPARVLLPFLQSQLRISKIEAQRLIHDGAVSVAGRTTTAGHRKLDAGDSIIVEYSPPPPKLPAKEAKRAARQAFSVLYDDEHLLIVDKPAGLLTVPTPYRERQTLIGHLNRYELQRSGGQVYCVHRLDRGVSGVLAFAKSLDVAERLRNQFAARKPERRYVAIVAGKVQEAEGSRESYLATDRDLNRYSTEDEQSGQYAVTHWRRLNEYPDATMLQVQLETGRRNQIRVHLAELGHPILGDPRYSPEIAKHRHWPYGRLALHAQSLGLEHPATGQPIQIDTAWPEEFRNFHRRGGGTTKRDKGRTKR